MVDEPTQADALLYGEDASCANLTPLIKARLRQLESGQVLEVVTDEPTAETDITAWCGLTGHALLAVREEAGTRRFTIRKK
jgi:tRNA 2-thiouridine synthesizing protein A